MIGGVPSLFTRARGFAARRPASTLAVAARAERVLAAKALAGKTFDQLAAELGTTNTYAAQLVLGQAQLRPETAKKLRSALPSLEERDVAAMRLVPDRRFDPSILQEPLVYRLHEAVTHYGQAIKMNVNEQCGRPPSAHAALHPPRSLCRALPRAPRFSHWVCAPCPLAPRFRFGCLCLTTPGPHSPPRVQVTASCRQSTCTAMWARQPARAARNES
jgi:cyanate lyase